MSVSQSQSLQTNENRCLHCVTKLVNHKRLNKYDFYLIVNKNTEIEERSNETATFCGTNYDMRQLFSKSLILKLLLHPLMLFCIKLFHDFLFIFLILICLEIS